MSTRQSIKFRSTDDRRIDYHLYEDCFEVRDAANPDDAPVYLELTGVHVIELATLDGEGAGVTIEIPREAARELGLLPPDYTSSLQTARRNASHAP